MRHSFYQTNDVFTLKMSEVSADEHTRTRLALFALEYILIFDAGKSTTNLVRTLRYTCIHAQYSVSLQKVLSLANPGRADCGKQDAANCFLHRIYCESFLVWPVWYWHLPKKGTGQESQRVNKIAEKDNEGKAK